MDKLTPTRRSEIMRRIGRKNTPPELAVRRCLHGLGLRFRLHLENLPGKPDIVLRRYRLVIFVNGCFWHGCPTCYCGARIPKSNVEFWRRKVERNQARDVRVSGELREDGWNVVTVWECQTKNPADLKALISEFMLGFGWRTKNAE